MYFRAETPTTAMPPSPKPFGSVPERPEQLYRDALADGRVTTEQFIKNCASYGFTRKSHGSAFDDKCMAHEHAKKIGPVFGSKKASRTSVVGSPILHIALLLGAGVALYAVIDRSTGPRRR